VNDTSPEVYSTLTKVISCIIKKSRNLKINICRNSNELAIRGSFLYQKVVVVLW
jgi:hypothetical protein